MSKNIKNIVFAIFCMFLVAQCSTFGGKKEEVNSDDKQIETKKKKKRYKFNTDEKIQDYVEKEGGLIFNKPQKYQFSSRNVMWKASLEALSDLPILSASYSGGVISTDWYGDNKSQLRINVIFNSNEISPSSIKITSFVKKCDDNNQCKISNGSNDFNSKIKDKIIQKVKSIKIAEANKK